MKGLSKGGHVRNGKAIVDRNGHLGTVHKTVFGFHRKGVRGDSQVDGKAADCGVV